MLVVTHSKIMCYYSMCKWPKEQVLHSLNVNRHASRNNYWDLSSLSHVIKLNYSLKPLAIFWTYCKTLFHAKVVMQMTLPPLVINLNMLWLIIAITDLINNSHLLRGHICIWLHVLWTVFCIMSVQFLENYNSTLLAYIFYTSYLIGLKEITMIENERKKCD